MAYQITWPSGFNQLKHEFAEFVWKEQWNFDEFSALESKRSSGVWQSESPFRVSYSCIQVHVRPMVGDAEEYNLFMRQLYNIVIPKEISELAMLAKQPVWMIYKMDAETEREIMVRLLLKEHVVVEDCLDAEDWMILIDRLTDALGGPFGIWKVHVELFQCTQQHFFRSNYDEIRIKLYLKLVHNEQYGKAMHVLAVLSTYHHTELLLFKHILSFYPQTYKNEIRSYIDKTMQNIMVTKPMII